MDKPVLKHLRYFWLGIANKPFWCMIAWPAYSFAPVYFHFSMEVAAWWYLVPVGALALALIYTHGKAIAEKPNE